MIQFPEGPSAQERYAPTAFCFGCGPANPDGLRIRTFLVAEPAPNGGRLYGCRFTPEAHHRAFDGVLNGGIIGALLDCHGNWTAALEVMARDGREALPCTVTAEFTIRLRRPTPVDGELLVRAWAQHIDGAKVNVEGSLEAGGKVCATMTGLFVEVGPGHPGYHRW
jgi:acyl-coenzyme A thioesterase PaaI-like protein